MSEPTYIGDAIAETESEHVNTDPVAMPLRSAYLDGYLMGIEDVQSGEIITDEMRALAKIEIRPMGYDRFLCLVCQAQTTGGNLEHNDFPHTEDCVAARARRICGEPT